MTHGKFLNRPFDVVHKVLAGVGDGKLGEWEEVGEVAYHLRRRLTEREMKAGGILGVEDVRGTNEHERRVEAVRPFLPKLLASRPWQAYE
jgi:hypothetical protein